MYIAKSVNQTRGAVSASGRLLLKMFVRHASIGNIDLQHFFARNLSKLLV